MDNVGNREWILMWITWGIEGWILLRAPWGMSKGKNLRNKQKNPGNYRILPNFTLKSWKVETRIPNFQAAHLPFPNIIQAKNTFLFCAKNSSSTPMLTLFSKTSPGLHSPHFQGFVSRRLCRTLQGATRTFFIQADRMWIGVRMLKAIKKAGDAG